MPQISNKILFLADATVGKLAKHLRLLGFDTLWDPQVPRPDRLTMLAGDQRIILTRSGRVRRVLHRRPLIFIQSDHLPDQLRQVRATLNLLPGDLQPFTRCAQCNDPLASLPRMEAQGRVPDYVWQQHIHFKNCPKCGRIYWPGSHAERWRAQLMYGFVPEK